MKLTVSNGKNQVTVFKGMYFVIDIPMEYQFQLRTHSRPKLKGYKFQRVDKDNPVKVYVLKDDDTYDRQNPFIFMISDFKQDIVAKKLYLSAVDNQIHFAYEGTKLLQKPKSLDATAMDALVDDISLILSVIDTLGSKRVQSSNMACKSFDRSRACSGVFAYMENWISISSVSDVNVLSGAELI